jgi:hypothetical protein
MMAAMKRLFIFMVWSVLRPAAGLRLMCSDLFMGNLCAANMTRRGQFSPCRRRNLLVLVRRAVSKGD